MLQMIADLKLDRGLGQGFTLPHARDVDMETSLVKPMVVPLGQPVDKQYERRFGRLELVALILQLLDPVEDASEERRILFQPIFGELLGDVRLAGKLAHEHSALVADGLGVDVLVAGCDPAHAVNMHPPLVSECAGPHKGLIRPEIHVGRVVDVAGDLREVNQLAGQEHLVIGILDRQVGYDAAEVGIAAPLTQTVDRALNLAHPVPYRGQRVGHGQLAVVVRVNAERNSDLTRDFLDGLGDLFGKRAAIGVAKHDPGGPGIGGSPQGCAARNRDCA